MKKKLLFTLAAFVSATAALLTSCNGKEKVLEVNIVSPSLTAEAGSIEVEVLTKKSWDVTVVKPSAPSDWFDVDPMSGSGDGTITVTVDQNDYSYSREIKLRISAGGTFEEISITQPAIILAQLDLYDVPEDTFSAAGGTATIRVESNTDWEFIKDEGFDWVTITPPSGNGDGSVTLHVASNTEISPRNLEVTAKAGSAERKFTVSQRPDQPLAEITADNMVGTWKMTGWMIFQGVNENGMHNALMTHALNHDVVIEKDGGSNTSLVLKNFSGPVPSSGYSQDVFDAKAKFYAADKTFWLEAQELTPAPAGGHAFLASYDVNWHTGMSDAEKQAYENTRTQSMPLADIEATEAHLVIELKSANPSTPREHGAYLPDLLTSRYYSAYLYTQGIADDNSYFRYIYVDMKLEKFAN